MKHKFWFCLLSSALLLPTSSFGEDEKEQNLLYLTIVYEQGSLVIPKKASFFKKLFSDTSKQGTLIGTVYGGIKGSPAIAREIISPPFVFEEVKRSGDKLEATTTQNITILNNKLAPDAEAIFLKIDFVSTTAAKATTLTNSIKNLSTSLVRVSSVPGVKSWLPPPLMRCLMLLAMMKKTAT